MTEAKANGRRTIWWVPQAKELVAFGVGISMVLHQTFVAPTAQIAILVVGASFMGVIGNGVAQRFLKKALEE